MPLRIKIDLTCDNIDCQITLSESGGDHDKILSKIMGRFVDNGWGIRKSADGVRLFFFCDHCLKEWKRNYG